MYDDLKNKNNLYDNEVALPIYTPFVVLFSIKATFELIHGDIADVIFLAKSSVDLKYCLYLLIFLPVSYTYPMKRRNHLKKKMEIFYNNILKKEI